MLQMNGASFYGKKIVRALPAESEDSELESENEDEQSASTAAQNRGCYTRFVFLILRYEVMIKPMFNWRGALQILEWMNEWIC